MIVRRPVTRRARRLGVVAASALALALVAGCTSAAPRDPRPEHGGSERAQSDRAQPVRSFVDAGAAGVTVRDGDDWTLPSWVRAAPNSGFFSEDADPAAHVGLRSVDVTWRQLQPREGGAIDRSRSGSAEGMELAPLGEQLHDDGDYWMRVFASAKQWAPSWVQKSCGVATYGPDYDGQRHLPIWNECVWSALLASYRTLFVDDGLAADPHLRFVYVPGAFTWAEFDYDIIGDAVKSGDLDWAEYSRWYSHAWTDLATLFGPYANKLVFTGEDYPFGPFGERDDLLARQATDAGLGIRTGITELSNFHLSEAPSYGSHVEPNGHLVVDESLPIHDGTRVVATENECYTDCGYTTDDPYYAVRQSNLKALQLRMNWIYVVPDASYLARYAGHWNWVRLSAGQTAATSADAWAELRDATDEYWRDAAPPFSTRAAWPSRPWVRNLERWLVQVDEPGSVAHRSDADVHRRVFEKDNGTAHEGLTTRVADGDTGFVFAVDPRFAAAAGSGRTVVKVTYLDRGDGGFVIDTPAGSSAVVERGDTGRERTATLALPEGALGGDHRIRLSLEPGADDLVVRFVRVVRVDG